MKLTTFFLNGSTQVTNLTEAFFFNDKKSHLLSALELEQKAKTTALDIAGEKYYNYHLDWDKKELINDYKN